MYKKKQNLFYIPILILSLSVFVGIYLYQLYQSKTQTGIFDYDKNIDREACLEMFYNDFFWVTDGYKKEEYNFAEQLDTGISKRYGKLMPFEIKVARYKGKTAGFITLLHEHAGCGTILLLCVKQEYRRLHFATQLVTHALNLFREKKYKIARLDVLKANIRAQNLYKKLGFQELSLYDNESKSTMFCCKL